MALPDSAIGPDGGSAGLPRAWIVDKSDTPGIAGRVYDLLNARLVNQPHGRPDAAAVDLAGDLLGGRGDPQADVARMVSVFEEHCARLTRDQYRVLDMACRIPRFEVVGGAGTGKTWLAIEQARRWAAAGRRVALLCYSRGLATWIDWQVAAWPKVVRRKVRARTFHGLGVEWGAEVADGLGAQFWEDQLPAQMLGIARGLDVRSRFDALVVDEAQDFRASWWEPLLAALRDPATAPIAVFSDEQQRIFDRPGGRQLQLVPLELVENLRNTRQIGAAFLPLASPAPRLLGGDGPPVGFVAATDATAMDAADDAAVALLDQGWAAKDVAVVSTQHRHIEQISRVEHYGRDGYWATFWHDDDLFFSTVAGFKGLERPAVVLAVDGFRDPATARETLYVGLSRARDLLVVVADPATLMRVGGPQVAARVMGRA